MKQPFKINIDQAVLDDLKRRVSNTRWTDEIDNEKWEMGANKSYLKELCSYWQHGFDWRKQEALLNSFAQYKAVVDDFTLHFIYEEGKGTTRIPLLITHGWPDSIVRFYKLIPLLTAADENGLSFDVVAPSIPGFGFSEIPTKKGMNPKKIAGLFNELMTKELGYDTYYAHGGDWGSSITEQVALYHSKSVLGIHLTDVPFGHSMKPPKDPTAAEEAFLKKTKMWREKEGAYSSIQATKPQTVAYGLNDSPAGLAGWIVEKFDTWSDNDGNIENAFSKDELLTNLTIYWATGTINSSMRLYYEALQAILQATYNPLMKLNPFDKTDDKVEVPAAFARFPKEISHPPKEFAERFFNVQQWTEMSKGGHFAALEEPKLLAEDIRKFVKTQSDLK